MKEYSHPPQKQSRTSDNTPRASRQSSVSDILQAYKNGTLGKQPVQRESIDDELLQGKFETAQREESPSVKNETGIPDGMKAGFENLSGLSFDDVQVHYNSDKPAQLHAFAYTQGNQVHIAPGQEKHLGHELGHIVQQKEGRVQPTVQLQGINVNDDEGLEKEADEMSLKSIQKKRTV